MKGISDSYQEARRPVPLLGKGIAGGAYDPWRTGARANGGCGIQPLLEPWTEARREQVSLALCSFDGARIGRPEARGPGSLGDAISRGWLRDREQTQEGGRWEGRE